MPAEKQVEAVEAMLRELNSGFPEKVTHKIEDGVVTELRFVTDKVTDISPLQVFNALQVLDCGGTHINYTLGNGQLADLTPLKGMNLSGLTELDLSWTKVGDAGLAHFKDCKKLTNLRLSGTQVSDVGMVCFKGRKDLAVLDLFRCTKVSDAGLAHFKDCKNLTNLSLGVTQVSDAGLAYFKDRKDLTVLDLASVYKISVH